MALEEADRSLKAARRRAGVRVEDEDLSLGRGDSKEMRDGVAVEAELDGEDEDGKR